MRPKTVPMSQPRRMLRPEKLISQCAEQSGNRTPDPLHQQSVA